MTTSKEYFQTRPFGLQSESVDIIVIICNMLALARSFGRRRNVCCVKSPVSGLLSAVVNFMTWQTPFCDQSRSSAVGAANNTALVYLYDGMYKCEGKGCTRNFLTQPWVSLRVLVNKHSPADLTTRTAHSTDKLQHPLLQVRIWFSSSFPSKVHCWPCAVRS